MKILLATDGSEHAELAESLIRKLPNWRSREIYCVSVAVPPSFGIGVGDPVNDLSFAQEAESAWDFAKHHAEECAAGAAQRLRDQGGNTTAIVLHGDTSSELLDFVKKEAITLVVIGSRGYGPLKSMFLGSIARRMLAYSDSSVLVARVYQNKTEAESIVELDRKEKLSVAVCYDGSQGAELALERAVIQGPGVFSKAIALCAEPLTILPLGVEPANFGATYQYDHELAQQIAQKAAERLKACADQVAWETMLGRPASVLLESARKHEVDLVALGATRHGIFERFLLGSVSFEVATSAPCSVLVVRPHA